MDAPVVTHVPVNPGTHANPNGYAEAADFSPKTKYPRYLQSWGSSGLCQELTIGLQVDFGAPPSLHSLRREGTLIPALSFLHQLHSEHSRVSVLGHKPLP